MGSDWEGGKFIWNDRSVAIIKGAEFVQKLRKYSKYLSKYVYLKGWHYRALSRSFDFKGSEASPSFSFIT